MAIARNETSHQLDRDGYSVHEDVVPSKVVDALLEALGNSSQAKHLTRQSRTYGIRNLLECVEEVAQLASMNQIRSLAESAIGTQCFPVRGLFFDKVPEANWRVPWHQDLTIAIKEKREVDGYGPWSTKAGVSHVQPPAKILESMVSIRIHLDDCDIHNGPLKVVPGSHQSGRLSHAQVLEAVAEGNEVDCIVRKGGAVIMKPLIVHSSSPARAPSHRRVVHLDFASRPLDGGLEWYHKARTRDEQASAPHSPGQPDIEKRPENLYTSSIGE